MKRTLLLLLVLAAIAIPFLLLSGLFGGDNGDSTENSRGRSSLSVAPGRSAISPSPRPDSERAERSSTELAVAPRDESATASETQTPSASRVAQSIDSQWTTGQHFLTGTLMGPSGPVNDAVLSLSTSSGKAIGSGRSASGGRFHLAVGHKVNGAWLNVDAQGYAPLVAGPYQIVADEPLRAGVLRLVKGTAQAGRVIGPNGKPVAAAEVRLHRGGRIQAPDRPLLTTIADHDGRFRFERAPRGAAVFEARAKGYGTRQAGPLTLPRSSGVEIKLAEAHAMVIQVREPGGRPIPDAAITLAHARHLAPDRTVTTDNLGQVRLEDLGAPTWELRASAATYRPERIQKVEADGPTVVVELKPWPCVEGLITDFGGSPPPQGTRVVAIPSSANGAHQPRRELERHPVSEDGTFRLCDLRPGHYVVRVESDSRAPTTSPPVRVEYDRNPRPVHISLQAGGGLKLTVRAKGGALPGATVEVHDREPDKRDLWHGESSPAQSRGTVPAIVVTADENGEATMENLASGSVWLLFRAEGHVPLLRGPYSVKSGRTDQLSSVVLQPAGQVEGRVVSVEGGRVVVGARLTIGAVGKAVEKIHLVSDRRGNFISPPLPPGAYEIVARRGTSRTGRGRIRKTVTIQAGSKQDVELALD